MTQEKNKYENKTLSEKIQFQMDIVAMDFENGVQISMKIFYNTLKDLLYEAEQLEEMKNEELEKVWKASEMNMRSQFSSPAYKNIMFEEWFDKSKK